MKKEVKEELSRIRDELYSQGKIVDGNMIAVALEYIEENDNEAEGFQEK